MAAARPAQQPASAQPRQKPAGKGFHLDFMMPFRASYNFVVGTIGGALDGMAQWGQRGFKIGLASGVIMGIFGAPAALASLTFLPMVMVCCVGGIAGGMAVGATAGALTGGLTRASRMEAREAALARRRTQSGSSIVTNGDLIDRINDSNFDRQLQQNQENAENRMDWRDRISDRSEDNRRER